MKNKPITEIDIGDLESYLETEGFRVHIYDESYSMDKLYSNHICHWLMAIDDNPACVVSYYDCRVRFQFAVPIIVQGKFIPSKLRKDFPQHKLTAKVLPDLGITDVRANIQHTEPLIYLTDSLKAAKALDEHYMYREGK